MVLKLASNIGLREEGFLSAVIRGLMCTVGKGCSPKGPATYLLEILDSKNLSIHGGKKYADPWLLWAGSNSGGGSSRPIGKPYSKN